MPGFAPLAAAPLAAAAVATASPVSRKVIFLRVGDSGPWTVPPDWTNDNKVHCIGGGGSIPDDQDLDNGPFQGAGGGAYSALSNLALTPGASISFGVGASGGLVAGSVDGGDTWFNGSTFSGASVAAKGGMGADGSSFGQGGQASAGLGTIRFSGGSASPTDTAPGGGAAGPDGDGGSPTDSAVSGGAGNAGAAGGGAGGARLGPGGAGTYWTQTKDGATAGPGGGGGMGGRNSTAGGAYGGGAGSGGEFGAGAHGGDGLIVIEYTAAVAPAWTTLGNGDKRIFLTWRNGGQLTLPSDWTDTNIVECIGQGFGGVPLYRVGGGGGAYARKANITGMAPGAAVDFQAPHGYDGSTNTITDTWFVDAATVKAAGATGHVGGQASNSIGDTVFSGGIAISANTCGGGAAGPNGDGGNGSGLTAGSADGGTVAGPATGSTGGVPGNSGTEWDSTHGCGTGGGRGLSAGTVQNGGAGGQYGGGGGSSSGSGGSVSGPGGDGLIVITYTPIFVVTGTGALGTTSFSTPVGTVAAGAGADGDIATVNLSAPSASGAAGAAASAAFASVSLTAPIAVETGNALVGAPIGVVTLSVPFGAASGSSTTSGQLATATISALAGIGSGPAVGSGVVGTIAASGIVGSTAGSARVSAAVATVALAAALDAATGAAAISGPLAAVSLLAPVAAASGTSETGGGFGIVTTSAPGALVSGSAASSGAGSFFTLSAPASAAAGAAQGQCEIGLVSLSAIAGTAHFTPGTPNGRIVVVRQESRVAVPRPESRTLKAA